MYANAARCCRLSPQWGKLTDDDLDRIAGKRDELEGTIQERYGIEKDRVHADVDDWCDRQKSN
ncbi:CsbD family protein [Pararhizobium sp. BT-229]|uniref:CsbD family protein n=1 Tax=Pararhizobium sp. BT-229 TaxID=2986923 RepID=UPI0021F771F0|nr:CsbD family protein [Pararhizobium sp. BT-229]MCV9966825.1 CsbD family protein [Pararhizobium sp. BT-229]